MPLPFLAPILMTAGSAIAGALSNKKKTTTTTPEYSAEFSPIKDALISNIMSRLQQPSALPRGYAEGNIRGINQTYTQAGQGLANKLTARGLGQSPIAGQAMTNLALGRAGSIAEMKVGMPMAERTFRNQDLAMGQSILNMGKGVSSTDPGNMLGGAFTSAADMLAYLYGKGAFNAGGGGASAAPITINGAAGGSPLLGVGNPLLKKPGFTGWAPR